MQPVNNDDTTNNTIDQKLTTCYAYGCFCLSMREFFENKQEHCTNVDKISHVIQFNLEAASINKIWISPKY